MFTQARSNRGLAHDGLVQLHALHAQLMADRARPEARLGELTRALMLASEWRV